MKCLFLRCRYPNSHIYNAIISSIYPELDSQLYKEGAAKLRHDCTLKMSDFRHQYLKKLDEMKTSFIKENEENE
jgi:hypothetical protein